MKPSTILVNFATGAALVAAAPLLSSCTTQILDASSALARANLPLAAFVLLWGLAVTWLGDYDPDTIDERTVSYLLLMAFGVAAVFAALLVIGPPGGREA